MTLTLRFEASDYPTNADPSTERTLPVLTHTPTSRRRHILQPVTPEPHTPGGPCSGATSGASPAAEDDAASYGGVAAVANTTKHRHREKPQQPEHDRCQEPALTRRPTPRTCAPPLTATRGPWPQGSTSTGAPRGRLGHLSKALHSSPRCGILSNSNEFPVEPPRGFEPRAYAFRAVRNPPRNTLLLVHTPAYPAIVGHARAMFRGISGAFRWPGRRTNAAQRRLCPSPRDGRPGTIHPQPAWHSRSRSASQ